MGTVIAFPDTANGVTREECRDTPGESAAIIILPVIRIEREGAPSADRLGPDRGTSAGGRKRGRGSRP